MHVVISIKRFKNDKINNNLLWMCAILQAKDTKQKTRETPAPCHGHCSRYHVYQL